MPIAEQSVAGFVAATKLTDKDRHDLRIPALLHHCGKITTPVHIVDKATRLQTIYDRVELIDTRFEVIKRDAEIRKWRRIAEEVDADENDGICRDFCQKCDVDRSILRKSNIGGEKTSDEDIEAVRGIGNRYRWGMEKAMRLPS